MKVTETISHQDGSKSTREIHIPFEKGRSQICYTLVPQNDEPIAVKIIESGWNDNGPLFHIITEYGDFMESDYDFGNMAHINQKWPEFESVWKEFFPDVIVSSTELRNLPNDQELGKWTRKQSAIKRENNNL